MGVNDQLAGYLKIYYEINVAGLYKRSGVVQQATDVQNIQIAQKLRRKCAVYITELV